MMSNRKRWLFDAADQTWHLWPESDPTPGSEAYCGNVMDEGCTVSGSPGVYTKCEACLEALRNE